MIAESRAGWHLGLADSLSGRRRAMRSKFLKTRKCVEARNWMRGIRLGRARRVSGTLQPDLLRRDYDTHRGRGLTCGNSRLV